MPQFIRKNIKINPPKQINYEVWNTLPHPHFMNLASAEITEIRKNRLHQIKNRTLFIKTPHFEKNISANSFKKKMFTEISKCKLPKAAGTQTIGSFCKKFVWLEVFLTFEVRLQNSVLNNRGSSGKSDQRIRRSSIVYILKFAQIFHF